MKNTKIVSYISLGILIPAMFLSLGSAVLADDETRPSNINERSLIKTQMEERKTEIENKKQEIRDIQEKIREEASSTKAQMKDLREEKREIASSTRAETREARLTRVRITVENHTKNIIAKFESAIERITKLTNRIESRITKLDAEGVDTSKAKVLIADAKAKTEIAKQSLRTLGADITNALNEAENRKDLSSKIRTAIETVKNNIKSAHQSLVEAITSLKAGLNGRATTTPSVDNNTSGSTEN
ncbi:MAG: hypothetical protein HQ402_01260 [Parcubacteria group bacterium]|nr:hypothetical protein [Parcubacteria group bacterium]